MQPARRIHQYHAIGGLASALDGIGTDLWRRDLSPFAVHGYVQLVAQYLKLLDGRRAVGVCSNHQGTLATLAQGQCQLGGCGRLARALEANEHDHVGRRSGTVQAGRLAQGIDQLFVNDLDHLLGRRQAFHYLGANASFPDAPDKVLDDLKVHVSFQQRQPDLAQGSIDILLAQLAPVGEVAEYAL